MLLPPADIVALLSPFAPLFSRRVWRPVPLLVVGAILAPGRRMVSTVLRTVGLSQDRTFQTCQRVLNRAVWSSLGASRILLQMLVKVFAPEGPLVLGIDETIERRRGAKIAVTLARWYGDRDRPFEFVSQTAVWYHTGFVPVPIRWVRDE
jgi:DDE superfamily endonuclease